MIRMYGNVAEVCHYKVTLSGFTYYAKTKDEAEKLSSSRGTIEEIDTSAYDWLDGVEFDTRADALAAAEMGEAAYKAQLNAPTDAEKLSAKIDYPSMMSGIDIPGGDSNGA